MATTIVTLGVQDLKRSIRASPQGFEHLADLLKELRAKGRLK